MKAFVTLTALSALLSPLGALASAPDAGAGAFSDNEATTLTDVVRGEAVWNTGPDAEPQALASWQAGCEAWKKEVTARLASRLVYATCGVAKVFYNRGGTGSSSIYSYQYASGAQVAVVLDWNERLQAISEEIQGQRFDCKWSGQPNNNCYASATFSAQGAWRKSCDLWKANITSSMGARFLFASCEASGASEVKQEDLFQGPTTESMLVTFKAGSFGRGWYLTKPF